MSHLHGYSLSGRPRPSLAVPGAGPLGVIVLEPAAEAELLGAPGELVMMRADARGAAFAIARRGDAVVVWGRSRGTFEIDPARLRFRTDPGDRPDAWAHQLATVALPLALAERGAAAIHASGFAGPRGAVLLAGPSGRGKSTTSLLASSLGFAPLADDAAVFEPARGGPIRVFAGGAGFWATPRAAAAAGGTDDAGLADGRAERRIFRGGAEPPAGAVPVAAIAVLAERRPRLSIERLEPATALQRLVPALLHVGDRVALERSFTALAGVLERVPAWEVAMPQGLDRSRAELRALIERLSG